MPRHSHLVVATTAAASVLLIPLAVTLNPRGFVAGDPGLKLIAARMSSRIRGSPFRTPIASESTTSSQGDRGDHVTANLAVLPDRWLETRWSGFEVWVVPSPVAGAGLLGLAGAWTMRRSR